MRRSTVARGALFLILCVLLGAAAKLQVVQVNEYALAAKNNRLRPILVQAPRGTIYDRHGNVIAENVPAYQVMLMPSKTCAGNPGGKKCKNDMEAQIDPLRPILGLTDAQLAYSWKKFKQAPHLPMVLMSDAPDTAIARLEERKRDFPGVLVFEYAKRNYPAGSAVAHMIGYVAEITGPQLQQKEFEGYQQGRWIGQQGLERQYEKQLGGEPGMNYLEIDAMGRIKRWLPEELGLPAIPGKDLQLNIDLDLQRYIQGIFPKGFNGAFVAMDPETGGVLAYYSNPSYDPNVFTGGVSPAAYDSLMKDPNKPLFDRAGGSTQPPASTWKLPVAMMALEEKVITPEEVMPIACSGGMSYQGRYARCWEPAGHGRVDLIKGILHSCDVYFYQVGIRLHLKRFVEVGTKLGFQKRTGIDLPTEVKNIFPESLDFWRRHFNDRAPADNQVMSMAIGQGPVTMTPLKMMQLFSAMARDDGKAPTLRIVQTDSVSYSMDMHLTPDRTEALRKGMRRVVGPGGTAALTRLNHWDFMGKTGSAQSCTRCGRPDHAWFVGMGGLPGQKMEIVAGMFMQYGHHGWAASDYVANGINFYLSRKYGVGFDRYPTPRMKNAKGMAIPNWAFYPMADPVPGQRYTSWPVGSPPKPKPPASTEPAAQ
ncbi:MAG TPA: penicillin-binding protein 2 [Longimicrobiales bacterium]|nr:penicillin-binding protein 2 [Longimicrobiales bacterium]